MRSIQDIQKDIDSIEEKLKEAFNLPTFQEFNDESNRLYAKMRPFVFEKHQQTQVEWNPIPKYGDLMTLEKFIACCEGGGFIDYDGSGMYSDGERESNIPIWPSLVRDKMIIRNPEFTHVVWYNK